MSNIVFARARVRRVLQTTLAVALVGGVVATGGTPAVAAPEKVLQSVAITLGSDSTISGITSTTVRAGEDEELSSDSASFDPGAVAGDLPVRVLTSYRLGDRAGTDLSDIEGESGRVVIDVTVQNVTARPEQVVYNFNGAQRRQNALVATPLTVVASADLGEDALGSVVTADDVRPDDVTNGVLGRGAGRSADVQWAALLAPPRLGSSATFRLVQDTDDFQVPTFDLSVQPGLVTDPSVQALLEAAFSEDPSSTLKLETSTIELVSNVNTTLTAASAVLARIQDELGSTASTLGQKTIADLGSSASLVSTSLSGLAGDIDSLSSQMSSEMQSAQSETVAQFDQTISSMKKLLGDPRDFDDVPETKPVGCDDPLPDPREARSVTEQMIAVTTQLAAIGSATEDCEAQIRAGLAAAIGTAEDDQHDTSVIGSLRRTQVELQGQTDFLDAQRNALKAEFGGSLLGRFGDSLSDLADLVFILRNAAGSLKGNGGEDAPDINEALDDMDGLLEDLQEQLGAESELMTDVAAVEQAAADELDALADSTVAARVVDQRDELCALGALDGGGFDPAYDKISRDLVGADCDVVDPATNGSGGALQELLEQDGRTRAALEEIQELADPALLVGLDGELQAVRDMIQTQLDQDLPTKGDLQQLVRLVADLSNTGVPYFGEDAPEWPMPRDVVIEDPDPGSPVCQRVVGFDLPTIVEGEEPEGYVAPDPLEIMMLFYAKVACQQADMDADIDAAFNASIGLLDELAGTGDEEGDFDRYARDIDGARQVADRQVGDLVDKMVGALDDQADTIRSRGRATIAGRTKQLDDERDRLETTLDQQVAASLRRIEGTVADSNRNLVAAEKALKSDLDEVLLDLGNRDEEGSGLLGALAKGAADTGTATEGVIKANATTSEFAGVRSTALADVYLQQAQLSRSLELLEAYPAFGMDVPAGSSHLTVFTFQLGGS